MINSLIYYRSQTPFLKDTDRTAANPGARSPSPLCPPPPSPFSSSTPVSWAPPVVAWGLILVVVVRCRRLSRAPPAARPAAILTSWPGLIWPRSHPTLCHFCLPPPGSGYWSRPPPPGAGRAQGNSRPELQDSPDQPHCAAFLFHLAAGDVLSRLDANQKT